MFLPAGGQGIIAVEAKKGSEVLKILKKLNDKEAERALFAERKVLRLLGAGCTCLLYTSALCYIGYAVFPAISASGTKIHIGNAFVVLSAYLLGGVYGGLSGAVGLSIADAA